MEVLYIQSWNQVAEYLYQNGVPWSETKNFFTYNSVKTDETGVQLYLKKWTHPTIPAPTAQDLQDIDPAIDRSFPNRVSPRQFRLALIADGHAMADIETLIAGLPNADAATVEWEYANFIERDNDLVTSLAPALGYDTDEKINQLFREAGKI